MSGSLLRLAALLLYGASAGNASTVFFSGDFSSDDEVQLFTYEVENTGMVTVATTSYAGGGFQTILTLFDASGAFQFDNTGYGSASDATLSWNSLAGQRYFVALTEYDNFSFQSILDDGFTEQGNGNFTANLPFNNPVSGGAFLLPGGEQRTPAWAVEFSSADPSLTAGEVPEPVSSLLVMSGAAILAVWKRRRSIQ